MGIKTYSLSNYLSPRELASRFGGPTVAAMLPAPRAPFSPSPRPASSGRGAIARGWAWVRGGGCGVLLAGCLVATGWAQQSVTATSSGGVGGLGRFSTGQAWPVSGTPGMAFELGVFTAGFDPAVQPKAAWGAAWTSARGARSANDVDTWFLDGTAAYFSIQGSSAPLAAVPTAGTQYYIWGSNSRTLAATSEWVLLTNPAWTVVAGTTPQIPVFFDTKDAGTVAVFGSLTNGGRDLQSAKVLAAVDLLAFTGNVLVPAGQAATLKVSAIGTGLTYQWYKGASGDVSAPVPGALTATLVIGGITTATSYWVRISDGTNTLNSPAAEVALATGPAAVVATQQLVGPGYVAGDRVAITVTFTATAPLSRLDLAVLLPAGWALVGETGLGATRRPVTGTRDVLDWSWSNVPAGTSALTYTLAVPAGTTGVPSLAGLVAHVMGGFEYQGLVAPDPLPVPEGPAFHSADTNRDRKLSLLELTRVIELYSTRYGTARSGGYSVQAPSEDGFAPAPERPSSAQPTLTAWHAADTNRDGRISLNELLRVIELFNQRITATNVRTGAYLPRGDTEDGFTPASPST